MRRAAATACIAVVAWAAAAGAQSLPVGARVRVTLGARDSAVTGVLDAVRGDTLAVRVADSTAPALVLLPAVRRMEVSEGKHRHVGRGALIGFLAGGTAGALLGSTDANRCEPGSLCIYSGRGVAAALGGALGAVSGTLVGALVGLNPRERWRVVPLPGGAAAGASLRF